MKLNLGCGRDKKEDYINIDSNPKVKPDRIMEIPPLDFEDNSIEEIRAHHFLEHIKDIVELMNECWRVLKPGGIMDIVVPYALSHAAFQDPYHVRFFVPESFFYFSAYFNYLDYPIKQFQILENRIDGNSLIVKLRK